MSTDLPAERDPAPHAMHLLDRALGVQAPLIERYVERYRRGHPDATPEQMVKWLNARLRAATIGSGAGVGAAAAAPGVGTGVAVALSAGETAAFMNATALYVLARAAVQGIPVQGMERRRTLVMAVMLGNSGAASVQKVADRTGKHWARQIVRGLPQARIKAVNKVLGHHFVTKYGTRQGIVVLGRVIPFGIGAAIGGTANAVLSQGIIKAADVAFGAPPARWDEPAQPSGG